MNLPGLCIKQLAYLGPNRADAIIDFGPGLNVIYGASDTGKSFVLDSIDFMLGGKRPLRDLPERVGYDRVRLTMGTPDSSDFVIERSTEGGGFRIFEDIDGDKVGRPMAEQHSNLRDDNLSSFLLAKICLSSRKIKKNVRGDTQSLSFRNLARLVIINEDEIHQQRSPLSDGNYTADTANASVFKLLLTGLDDSALVSSRLSTPEAQSRGAQLELLEQLIREYRERIKEIAGSPAELDEQLERLDAAMATQGAQLAVTEAEFRQTSEIRRSSLKQLEEATNRLTEVEVLLERFGLLMRHYASDVQRLRGIGEAGTLFMVLGGAPCPLCGAEPQYHQTQGECDGDVAAVVSAARAEVGKVETRQRELTDTIASLNREARNFKRKIPKLESEVREVSKKIEEFLAPTARKLRFVFSQLATKRGDVKEALSIFQSLKDLENRKADLERADEAVGIHANSSEGDLSTAIVDQFSSTILDLLKSWSFPDLDRLHFDLKTRDLVINGKQRTSFGKGLRAISQAAFTIGLLRYCRKFETSHPGFVILDSPLLSYREPDAEADEQAEDDLRGTDLKPKFYDHLRGFGNGQQVIVIENTDPPEEVQALPNAIKFTRSLLHGRYGFFPRRVAEEPKQLPPT